MSIALLLFMRTILFIEFKLNLKMFNFLKIKGSENINNLMIWKMWLNLNVE